MVKKASDDKKVLNNSVVAPITIEGRTKIKKAKKVSSLNLKKKNEFFIVIDYPKNNEIITHKLHYAIRIGTPNIGSVEISIDEGEFQKCRYSSGYWWYDWYNIPLGKHTLVAKLVDPQKNRTLKKSEKVVCIVK